MSGAMIYRRPLDRMWRSGLGLLLAVGATAGCGGETAPEASEAPVVALAPQDVATARTSSLETGVVLSGTLQPSERATVTAQVAGTIGQVNVDRGTSVRRGEVMAVIVAAGVRSEAAGARAGVAAAQANLDVARRQRDASQALYEGGAISELEFRRTEAALNAAEAQLAAARAQAAGAGEQASRATITAPISGIVSARSVEPGEAIRVGDPMFEVVNSSSLELAGQIPVDAAGGVQPGQIVSFSLDAFPGQEFAGSVARVDPVADPQTRQVGVYVRLPNADRRIVGGQFARGRLIGQTFSNVVVVPTSAVMTDGGAASVYVVADGRVTRRTVTPGARDERAGVIVVESGLQVGEQVLIQPTTAIADGTRVTLAGSPGAAGGDTAAAPAAAAAAPAPAATPDRP